MDNFTELFHSTSTIILNDLTSNFSCSMMLAVAGSILLCQCSVINVSGTNWGPGTLTVDPPYMCVYVSLGA